MASLFGHFMSICFLSEVPPHWCLSEVHQLFGDDLRLTEVSEANHSILMHLAEIDRN